MPVIGYARLSTTEQAQGQALEQQLHRLREAGAAEVFHDLASGTRDDRPQLHRALALLRTGAADTLICTRLDRLTRSASFNSQLCDLFGEPGPPHLLALDDAIDTSTIGGRMQFRLLGIFSQAEVERIKERTVRGLTYRREVLGAHQGRAPFGFCKLPRAEQLTLDPEQAPIAAALVDRFIATGGDARRTSLWLLETHGIRMAPRSLRDWVVSPSLVGDSGRSWPRPTVKGRRVTQRKGWERIDPDTHPPLIDRAKAAEVQAAIEASRRTPGGSRRGQLEAAWFSSRFRCGACGHTFRRHRLVLHCPNPLCAVRYGRGSVQLSALRQELLRGLWWLAGGIAQRQAAARLVAASDAVEPPAAIQLRQEISALRGTGVTGLEAVLQAKEQQLAAILRAADAGATAAGAAAQRVTLQAADWEVLRSRGDAALLVLLRDAQISGEIHGGRLRILRSERWEPMVWVLERDGTDLVVRIGSPEATDAELATLNPIGDGPAAVAEELPPVQWEAAGAATDLP